MTPQEIFKAGLALHQKGKLIEAERAYLDVLRSQPKNFDALQLLGVIALQTERFERAVELIRAAIAINASIGPVHNNLGYALSKLRRFDEALTSYDKAITLTPNDAEAFNNRVIALHDLNRLDEALASYDQAIALSPRYANAYCNKGNLLLLLERPEEALASCDKAIALNPKHLVSYCNRGNALRQLKRFDEALASYDTAVALHPKHAGAHGNRGNALRSLGRFDEALASYDTAIDLQPDDAEGYVTRALMLNDLRRREEALANYEKAISLRPDYAEAYVNRAATLNDLGRFEDALANYDTAIVLNPDYAEAYVNRAETLIEMKRFEDALASYDKAVALNPNLDFLFGERLYTKMKICDWNGLDEGIARLNEKIERNEKACQPFIFISMSDSPSAQKKVTDVWVRDKYPPRDIVPSRPTIVRRDKIRVGYFSADFHDHATVYLAAELFERHDKSKTEIIAFSFGPESHGNVKNRLVAAFDKFIDVRAKSDAEIAQLSRDMQIDIAVDMKGFTQYGRAGIFAARAAPVQVNYLGYPVTMGASYMDYIVADATLIPNSSRDYYTEKIIYLPDSYQPNDSKRHIADRVFTRAELALPDAGFVFCCFNNNYKITPATFDGWMRILARVEGSVIWLLEDNAFAARNLRAEAARRGIDSGRLIFAKRMPLDLHLARHRAADLFLDTYPYNAHTTASDALWTGLPLLTLPGESFASRVASSLLNALGLPELIAASQNKYESLAVDLANDPERLRIVKNKLTQSLATAPLFDSGLYTRNLEQAFTQIYDRYHQNLPPIDLHVAR